MWPRPQKNYPAEMAGELNKSFSFGALEMNFMKVLLSFLVIIFGSLIFVGSAFPHEKKLVGLIERVKIYPGNLVIHAKFDTGARHSSLHATNITRFKRKGEKWIRFDVSNRAGEKVTLERKVERVVGIKRKKGESRKRMVVRLGICLGDLYKEVEVNLEDRRKFAHVMLIGRSFMLGDIHVDPSTSYTTEPTCREISHR